MNFLKNAKFCERETQQSEVSVHKNKAYISERKSAAAFSQPVPAYRPSNQCSISRSAADDGLAAQEKELQNSRSLQKR